MIYLSIILVATIFIATHIDSTSAAESKVALKNSQQHSSIAKRQALHNNFIEEELHTKINNRKYILF
jgi:hypothetical protein